MLKSLARAWMFVLKNVPKNEEALLATKDLRPMMHGQLAKMRAAWGEGADLQTAVHIWDVEGMYPSMPKDLVRRAMRELLREIVEHAPSMVDDIGRVLRSQTKCLSVPKFKEGEVLLVAAHPLASTVSGAAAPYDGRLQAAWTRGDRDEREPPRLGRALGARARGAGRRPVASCLGARRPRRGVVRPPPRREARGARRARARRPRARRRPGEGRVGRAPRYCS